MELFGGGAGDVAGLLGPAMRGLGYLATLLATGAVMFALLVARRAADQAVARRVGVGVGVVGVFVAAAAVPVQAAAVGRVGVGQALTSGALLGDVLGSGFGHATILRVLALAALAVVWGFAGRGRDLAADAASWRGAVPAMAALAALWSYLLDGHQRAGEPAWLLLSADAIHLAAAAVWFAGAVLVALAFRARDDDAGAPVATAELVARFGSVAAGAFVAAAVAGVTMAWVLVGGVRALVLTSYGAVLVLKLALVAVVVLVARYNRRTLVPAVIGQPVTVGGEVAAPAPDLPVLGPSEAWRQLTATVRLEAALLVGVLLVTGVLVTVPAPAGGVASEPYEATIALDGLEADVVVDPARAGRNTVHAYVLDAQGRPTAEVADLRFEWRLPAQDVGPIVVEPLFAGTGHWIATMDDLRLPGDWELQVVATAADPPTESVATTTVRIVP